MGADLSRLTYDERDHYAGVLMQQGRVLLDSDWNEHVAALDHRLRAQTLDTFGRCVVPLETPDGFRIAVDGGQLVIGPGRIYVDGILAENHGRVPGGARPFFERHIEESRGVDDVPPPPPAPLGGYVPYDAQPHLPDTTFHPAPTGDGNNLIYVDVWRREVTHLEDPEIVEKAIGVDSTARVQTVWQVKALAIGDGVTCSTPDGQMPQAWQNLIAAPSARLSTSTVDVEDDQDPCIIAPGGGYRGLENRLYRVEIHDAGQPGDDGGATFKWARHNASIATAVTMIDGGTLTVASTGRDDVLRFNDGDWVEVIDDHLELAGQPGVMARVETVTDATRTIVLEAGVNLNAFATTEDDHAARHTRIRRWDQAGTIADADGNELLSVDDTGGVIPITADGATFRLEDGIVITLGRDGAGDFRTGDAWVFTARTVDASVEQLSFAPPRAIHHHYCRLAVWDGRDEPRDCRRFWPPDTPTVGEGHDCACTVCVSVADHNDGTFTINQAIDTIRQSGGTVCLEAGRYALREPVELSKAVSVRLRGHGPATVLAAERMAIRAEGAQDVTVSDLAATARDVGVDVRQSRSFRCERCRFDVSEGQIAVSLQSVASPAVVECHLRSGTCIRCVDATDDGTGVTATITDNRMSARENGLVIESTNRDNTGTFTIAENQFDIAKAHAILARAHAGTLRILRNSISARERTHAIHIDESRFDLEIRHNAFTRVGGVPIVVSARQHEGPAHIRVDHNTMRRLETEAIVVKTPRETVGVLSVDSNTVVTRPPALTLVLDCAGMNARVTENHLECVEGELDDDRDFAIIDARSLVFCNNSLHGAGRERLDEHTWDHRVVVKQQRATVWVGNIFQRVGITEPWPAPTNHSMP